MEEIDVWKETAFHSQNTFARERDEVVSQATLKTTERDSANSLYHELLAPLRRTVKVLEYKNDKPGDTVWSFVKGSTKIEKLQC